MNNNDYVYILNDKVVEIIELLAYAYYDQRACFELWKEWLKDGE